MKKIVSYLLLVCILITACPLLAKASGKILGSGKGGDGIYWKVHDDYTLEIYGTGEMENHSPAGAGWGSWIGKNIANATRWKFSENTMERIMVDTGITAIGDAAFSGCYYNKSVEIGSGVKEIGGWAFLQNENLETVSIPASVTKIYSMAFYQCDNLTDVYYGGTKAQWKKIIIKDYNEDLLNAKIHYEQPEFVGDYINNSKYKPTNVKGTLTAGDKVKVSWKKVSGARGYNIYYKKADGKYTKAGYTTELSKTISNLEGGTKYVFKVVPCFTASKVESKQYTEVSATTWSNVKNVAIDTYSSSKVKLTWNKVSGIDGYQISKSTKKTGTNSVASTISTSKTVEAAKNKTFYYKVRGYKKVNGKKVYTAWSDVVSYRLIYVGTPSNVKATLTDGCDVKVTWEKASGANMYYVSAINNGNYELTYRTSKLVQGFPGLSGGVKYTFKVVPLYVVNDEVVKEGKAKTVTATTLKKIDKPVVTTSGKNVKITWNNIDGETGYQISKSEKATGINIVSKYKTTKGTYKQLSAKPGVSYYYRVRAYKVVGKKTVYGEWSDVTAHRVIPVAQVGTYEADYGSTKYIVKIKKVQGNEVTFTLQFAGRVASGNSKTITAVAENKKISFNFKDYNAKGKVIGKGKGTLVIDGTNLILNTKKTSGNTQLSTAGRDEVLVRVSSSAK